MSRRRHAARPLAAEPLWYKDAVIYQVHVKSFFDSNNDGIGDLPGLTEKLDYIVELGATAIWLLPFYPSPRRDDGYDISDYHAVHPEYGTIRTCAIHRRRARARSSGDYRACCQPHLRPAPLVPAGTPCQAGISVAQVLCLGRQRPRLRRCAHHLHRHGEIELDLRSCGGGLFLASVLFAPAGSQLRQSARAPGGARGNAVLARCWRGRIPARRRSLPGRARRNRLREPPRDARDHQAHPRRPRPDRPRLHAARRGQ